MTNAMMNEMHYRDMANTRIVTRMKQVVILVAIIVAGIMISMATESNGRGLATKVVIHKN